MTATLRPLRRGIFGTAAASVFAGGIPMAIVMALLSGYLIKRAGVVGEDASVGILFAALFAIGVIMISVASSQGSFGIGESGGYATGQRSGSVQS